MPVLHQPCVQLLERALLPLPLPLPPHVVVGSAADVEDLMDVLGEEHVTRHTSPITHHPSPITHHPSPITHHPSPITHHPSPITHALPRPALLPAPCPPPAAVT